MDEKTLKALIAAGAVKRVHIIANGGHFYVRIDTPNDSFTALTLKGTAKIWTSLDSAAKWIRALGLGNARLDLVNWQPGQRGLGL
ncbi:MAG: hypothetical protein H7842_12175 [Gammaproteobacteria bacterium SHHR-1]|uniref:hypothetical protein n=1 Tax=Magnetovirga frankeli TaxID=947516 RepID=UPI0012934FF5|nr:hypothetical protein D5125_09435 [gamma proteobacterium SS-5]